MKRFIPLIVVAVILATAATYCTYCLKHGCFATVGGGSHRYIVYSSKETIKNRCDSLVLNNPEYISWQKNQYGEIYNPNIDDINKLYYYFNLPINDNKIIVVVWIRGPQQEKSAEFLVVAFTYELDFRGWKKVGDSYNIEREAILKSVEEHVLDRLGLEYGEPWGQYY